MTAILLKASKYARVGGIVVQALTLVLTITEFFSTEKNPGVARQPRTDDPEDGQ